MRYWSRVIRRSSFVSRGLTAFVVVISVASIASAALIADSVGSTTITGNDPCNGTGSFVIDIDYRIYDGTSSGDPLGLTSDWQIEFVLDHVGDDGETPAQNVGRFIAHSPDSWSGDFYTDVDAVGSGLAPCPSWWDATGGSENADRAGPIYLAPYMTSNRGVFFFKGEYTTLATLAPDSGLSQQLMLTVAPLTQQVTILLEINQTDTTPGIDGDVEIALIPEPASILLSGMAFYLLSRRRRQRT